MASLELTNVPDELLRRLSQAAAVGERDVAAEAVDRLDRSLRPPLPGRSHQELSMLARAVRVSAAAMTDESAVPGDWLSPEFIRAAREWGRE